MPDVAGALAFMYNLTGNNGQQIRNLVLNDKTVEDIFTGKITNWDDPEIQPPMTAAGGGGQSAQPEDPRRCTGPTHRARITSSPTTCCTWTRPASRRTSRRWGSHVG